MSAPTKTGLDYYPRSTDLLKDRKFVKAKIKYGYLAIVVYDALLEMIYSDKGYYIEYNNENKEEVVWDIMEALRGKYQVEADTIYSVIEMLVECRLFSHDHFKQGVITGKRIQETYYKCTVERKKVEVDASIWMLSVAEMTELSEKHSILLSKKINRTINEDNRPINGVNQPINQQSKVNKSKVNKSKVNKSKVFIPPTVAEIKEYAQEIHSDVDCEYFFNYYESVGWKCGKSNITDWKAKLRSWKQFNKTEDKPKTNKFVNYDQPSYTAEQIQAAIARKKAQQKGG